MQTKELRLHLRMKKKKKISCLCHNTHPKMNIQHSQITAVYLIEEKRIKDNSSIQLGHHYLSRKVIEL